MIEPERRIGSVAVLADTDSRWKWGLGLARRLNPEDIFGFQFAGADLPSERQLAEVSIAAEAITEVSTSDLLAALAARPVDVLVISLPGGGVQSILQLLAANPLPRRPLIITGYVGVVYERITEGLLLRVGADVIAANCPHDLTQFSHTLTGLGLDPSPLTLTRLPFLRGAAVSAPRDRFTVTFAGQPTVPASRPQRRYLVERLAEHARRHPDRDVVIKLRSMPGERATHTEPYPYDELVRALGSARPANLKVVGGDMGRMLNRTDLLITVSSTAAVEAIHRGIPTALLTDFGVREGLGNTYFIGSGCLTSFDQLDAGLLPQADTAWAHDHGLGTDDDPLPARVAELVAAGDLPPVRPYYTVSNAQAFLPALLADYGVGTDGRPLPQLSLAPGSVRRAVRRGARNMYRQGTEVVAPMLRRWAAL
ncbi:MAG: hypothetical protein LWW77_04790 [Propionibacteriales bacterium]|nr:hypothetical protein [Propionibacteriales bacterium]